MAAVVEGPAIIAEPAVAQAAPVFSGDAFGLGAVGAPFGATSFGGLNGFGAAPFGAVDSFGAAPFGGFGGIDSFGAAPFGAGSFGAAPFGAGSFGGLGGFGLNGTVAPGFVSGGPTVAQYAYQSGVQPFNGLNYNSGIVGPYPVASTFTGLAPTATGQNAHNYAGFGYNRPTAYGYEGTRFAGPRGIKDGPLGFPAAPVLPQPTPRPYAVVGSRTPIPPVGNYGVAKGRFARSSKRIQGTGSNAGERYYAG
jgi:hypothetical protein